VSARARPEPGAAGAGGTFAERLVVVFLVLAVAVLGYVRFVVIPDREPPRPLEFDLVNSMLDAQPGERVEMEEGDKPGVVTCMEVVAPGVVLRPPSGPDRIGPDSDLRHAPPYLVASLRYPPPGGGCDTPGVRSEIERFDLNGFGMPSSVAVNPSTIRPMWVRRGGSYHFVYEVVMTIYGGAGGTWVSYLSSDAPVTGTLFRTFGTANQGVRWVTYRDAGRAARPAGG
jgi:hypothetical protein